MPGVTPQRLDDDGPHWQPYLVIPGQDDYTITWLEYLPDGRRVVTCSGDEGTVRVWNLESGEQEGAPMVHEDRIYSFSMTLDRTKIITSDDSGRIKVWDVESHRLVREWIHLERCPVIAISPDDRLIAVGTEDVVIYTMDGNRVNHSIEVGYLIWSMHFYGNKLACATDHGIRVYDVNSGALILGPLGTGLVHYAMWSHDGSRLFSTSGDKTIRSWDSGTGEQIGHAWTGHTAVIHSFTLSPDGSILASASWDKTVRFWDVATGEPFGNHLQHDDVVCAVRFSPSGEFVASAGGDGKIYLWRAPWSNSAKSPSRTGLANNTMYCAQMPPLNLPSPYSMHILSIEQALDPDFCLFTTTPHPTTYAVVPNSHPSPPIQNSNPDENVTLAMSPISQLGLQYILPHPSLTLDECQHTFELRLRKLVTLATSKGLRVPHDFVPLSLPPVGGRNSPWNRPESIADNQNSMHVSGNGPSTLVFCSAFNGDPKKIRKIDKIKQKLVEMLGEIGFKLSNGRLPWSTLEGDLQKKGYVILNWPQGVLRDRDKGVSGLSAEDADKLHDALFVDEQRLRFVPRGDESTCTDGFTLPAVASGSAGPRESDRSTAGKQARFRVTTAEAYPHKKRRV